MSSDIPGKVAIKGCKGRGIKRVGYTYASSPLNTWVCSEDFRSEKMDRWSICIWSEIMDNELSGLSKRQARY